MTSDVLVLIGAVVILILAYLAGRQRGASQMHHAWEAAVPDIRKDAIKRSKAVTGGQFVEQLAPYLPDFPYTPQECRFIGAPIDFAVFVGAAEEQIEEVIFVEVKSGNSGLSSQERRLKEAVQQGKVRWEEYRAPADVTESGEG